MDAVLDYWSQRRFEVFAGPPTTSMRVEVKHFFEDMCFALQRDKALANTEAPVPTLQEILQELPVLTDRGSVAMCADIGEKDLSVAIDGAFCGVLAVLKSDLVDSDKVVKWLRRETSVPALMNT
jgi:hypothetical protein